MTSKPHSDRFDVRAVREVMRHWPQSPEVSCLAEALGEIEYLEEQLEAVRSERDDELLTERQRVRELEEQLEALREAMLYEWRMCIVDGLDYETPDGWAFEKHPWFPLLGLTVEDCVTMLRGGSSPATSSERVSAAVGETPNAPSATDQARSEVSSPASEPVVVPAPTEGGLGGSPSTVSNQDKEPDA